MPLSKASLERLIEASPDIVVATDADGTVAYYNDGAQENLGYARGEIIGQSVARLYPSLDEARRVMAAMRDPKRGGSGRVLNFPTRFLADEEHVEQGTIGFAKDLSEIIRRDQLAVLGEVAIGLSHEINNPLGVITNQLALLEREHPSARIESVRREIKRIEKILDRLSHMARTQRYASTAYVGDARMIDLGAGDDPLAGRRILVVDDDLALRESVVEILAADGCQVDSAADGREAVACLARSHYDVVLSDVVMPGMDGYELYQHVRTHHPDSQMVLMTAFYYDKDHVIKRSRLEGLEGVIFKKPIDPERLRRTLAKLLSATARAPSSR
ncbi:MAG: response regulator [Myxococcota bacterium]